MAQRYQTLRVLPGATPSPKNPKQHLSSPSAEELFRELGDHSYHFSSSGSTSLTPITTPTPSPVMADRFPSLEDIDIDIVPASGHSDTPRDEAINSPNVSAEDDFLTRERALLGDDDAARFAAESATNTHRVLYLEDDDLLVQEGTRHNHQTTHPAPAETVIGSDAVNRFQSSNQADDQEEEPEPIRLWRQRRDEDLTRRAEVSAKKKEATLADAARWTDSFYEDYNKNKDKAIAKARREAEEYLGKREDTAAGGTAWERVAKLVDLNAKGGNVAGGDGKEKFRNLLKDLRKDETAPGAKGY